MINWLKAKCPECGRIYEYPEGGYKPKVCSSFDCVHKQLHNPKKSVLDILREGRQIETKT